MKRNVDLRLSVAQRDKLRVLGNVAWIRAQIDAAAVLKPLAQAWSDWVPEPVRYVAHNMFSNLGDLWTAANQVLQGKPSEAASDLGRFVVNSTLGFAGAADVATEIGLEKHREDFGQTLGRWGVGSGPYLVLPFFGPSTVRDGLGQTLDLAVDPLQHVRPAGAHNNAYAARLIDTRAGLLRAGNMLDAAALDRYSFVREGYLQRRRNLIWDGNPPEEPEAPDEDGQPPAVPAR
jgi:phospholipid-binding lipoprotein MlaA